MQLTTMYKVDRFFPPRCPRCLAEFRSWDDIATYAGQRGASFVEALFRQRLDFPEIFGDAVEGDLDSGAPTARLITGETGEGELEATAVQRPGASLGIDFIICRSCENVTTRIAYASRTVFSREEAERLVDEDGFNFLQEIHAHGTAARRSEELSILAKADLDAMRIALSQARERSAGVTDESERADAVLADPALSSVLSEWVRRTTSDHARRELSSLLGTEAATLNREVKEFLTTAEVLKAELLRHSNDDPSIDFAPAVIAFAKALERQLLDRVFLPYAQSVGAEDAPIANVGGRSYARSASALTALLSDGREPTMGEMAHCLKNVGCASEHPNSFRSYLQGAIADLGAFCEVDRIPSKVLKYLDTYRNGAAHVERMTYDECVAAEAYLLKEPVRLIARIEEATASR